jgi:hypothetical protein
MNCKTEDYPEKKRDATHFDEIIWDSVLKYVSSLVENIVLLEMYLLL